MYDMFGAYTCGHLKFIWENIMFPAQLRSSLGSLRISNRQFYEGIWKLNG